MLSLGAGPNAVVNAVPAQDKNSGGQKTVQPRTVRWHHGHGFLPAMRGSLPNPGLPRLVLTRAFGSVYYCSGPNSKIYQGRDRTFSPRFAATRQGSCSARLSPGARELASCNPYLAGHPNHRTL